MHMPEAYQKWARPGKARFLLPSIVAYGLLLLLRSTYGLRSMLWLRCNVTSLAMQLVGPADLVAKSDSRGTNTGITIIT